MKRPITAVSLLVIVCLLALTIVAQSQATDPRVGIWKLNVAKSKYSPGPAPQTSVWRFENRADGFTVITISGTNSRGEPTFTHVVLKYDEKDYPAYGNASVTALVREGTKLGTMAHKLVDPYTMIVTPKDSKGVVGIPITVAISKDGKTLTQTVKGQNPQGQAVENVAIYDRTQ